MEEQTSWMFFLGARISLRAGKSGNDDSSVGALEAEAR
ncbi:unnamed protein product [Ectocarpus sp. 4 AP-2014]